MRQKVHITCTLTRVSANLLEELMALTGWDRSRCIEECVRAYAPELIKKFKKIGGTTGGQANKAENLSERYLRHLIWGDIEDELRK